MAKETFIIRTEWSDAIMDLKPSEQAIIFRNLFHYHNDALDKIKTPNLPIKLVWKMIEPNLKRNIDSYDKRRDTSSENGKKGGRPPNNLNKPNSEPNNLTENLSEPINPIVSVSVSVSDSDSVSVPTELTTLDLGLSVESPTEATPVARPPSKPEQAWINCKCEYSEATKEQWLKLCGLAKWRKKEIVTLEAALDRLMKYEEGFAKELLLNAISGNYQGIVFGNTDAVYYTWLDNKGKTNATHKGTPKGHIIEAGSRNYGKP